MSEPAAPAALVAAPTPPQQGRPPAERPGLGDGVRALFGGFSFILANPGTWPLALVPIAVALALVLTLGLTAISLVPPRVEALIGPTTGAAYGALAFFAKAVATLAAVLIAALISFGLAQPLSGPALERIVRRAEALEGAPTWPPTSLIDDIVRSLQSVLVGAAVGVPILGVLFVIDVLFPPAAIIAVPAKIAVTALLITWDLCDYPLSIRGLPVGQRVNFLVRNARAVFGFGVGLALIALIPCALLLVLPAGVAGAARLVVLLERFEAREKNASGAEPSPPRT